MLHFSKSASPKLLKFSKKLQQNRRSRANLFNFSKGHRFIAQNLKTGDLKFFRDWQFIRTLHIGYKNAWFFHKFCHKRCWKLRRWVIIHQPFETAGSFFLKIFIWENFVNMCNVTETWKICYKNYRSFHNFFQKRSSKLRK